MTHIELPRALEDYFAYAEIDPTRHGRRFTISMPYFNGDRLDRLQWWYHVSPAQEQQHGESILQTQREQATQRFRQHIERWLQNTGQRVFGAEPIPRIGPLAGAQAAAVDVAANTDSSLPVDSESPTDTNVLPWPSERVANG